MILPVSVVILCVGLAVSGSAAAETLSLQPLLREAVTKHPEVRQRRGEIQTGRLDLDSAKWSRFPSATAGVESVTQGSAGLITLRQPVWTGGKITGQIDYATAKLVTSQATLVETQQSVLQRSAQTYYDILRYETRLKIVRDNEAEHKHLLEIIQRRVASQVSPGTDETQAMARYRQVISERIQVELQLASARSALEQMLGRKVGVKAAAKPISMHTSTEDMLLDMAQAYSPERKRLLAQIETIDAEVALAQSKLKPELYVAYQARTGTLAFGQDRSRFYVGVEMQTGAGLSALSGIQSALSRKESEREKLAAAERILSNQIRSTWAEMNALNNQLEPVRALLVSSEDVVASYLRQFQVGRRSWLEVLNAQREKFQAYNTLADIENPLEFAKLRLLLQSGQVNAESLHLLTE
jgi:adhesin transport system outer membrane protein